MSETTVRIYASGDEFLSVCAPAAMSVAEVEAAVAELRPRDRWRASKAPAFACGLPNPCPCQISPDRVHRLLEAAEAVHAASAARGGRSRFGSGSFGP